MAGDELKRDKNTSKPAQKRELTDAAKRALAEADIRRKQQKANDKAGETGGPAGPEPTRYGDWERKGIVSDF